MNVRQLEEFIGSGDQKVFHILTVTHLYGGIAGTVGGAWFLQPLLGVWGFFLGGALGLASTWKRSGRSLYGWAFAYVRFVLRGLFKMGDVRVDADQYYASHRVRSAPYMVMRTDGSVVMVNRGSRDLAASDDPLDRLIVMPAPSPSGAGMSVQANALQSGSSRRLVLPHRLASPAGGDATSVASGTEVLTSAPRSWADTNSVPYAPESLPERREEATPHRHKEIDKEIDVAAWGLD